MLQASKAALFGGCGFIPDISSLQAWLEVAWAAGYDVMGREQLGGSVQGSRKWVLRGRLLCPSELLL